VAVDRADAGSFEPALEAVDMLGTELLRAVEPRGRILEELEEAVRPLACWMSVLRTTVGASSRRAVAKASASRRGRRWTKSIKALPPCAASSVKRRPTTVSVCR
jgi:hypothetical protein